MSASSDSLLMPMLRKLQHMTTLNHADCTALLGLPHKVRDLRAREFIAHDSDRAEFACVLLSGFAVRHKVARSGGRQIMSLHMTGDIIDLQNALLDVADHNVQAISEVKAAYVPVEAIQQVAADHPMIAKAMWRETLIEGSIFREWLLNVGRRNARTRTAHFLCELALRFEAVGLATSGRFDLPLTQEELGDILGLTAVHMNRTLHSLEAAHLIERRQRAVVIPNWERLVSAGDFNPTYLHLRAVTQSSVGIAVTKTACVDPSHIV